VVDVVSRLAARVKALRESLVDAQHSSYRIVLTPDRTVLREAQRAETYLNLFQYPVDSVYINRLLPASEDLGPYLAALQERQTRVMQEIGSAFAMLPRFEVPLTADEPVGVQRLSELARVVFGDRDPTDVMHTGPSLTVERRGAGYLLRIPMPNVEVERLDLTKRGDELYVDVGNFRRAVTLPLALADLTPGVARMRNGMLEIPFQQPATASREAVE
jgi:arsenite-transporting ATPase